MAETHESREIGNASAVLENLGGHTVALALVETTTGAAADYSSSVLAAVLEEIEGIVDLNRSRLRLGVAVDDCNDTAHFDVIVRCEIIRGRLSQLYVG